MPTLQELLAQKAALEQQIQQLSSAERAGAIAQVKNLMAQHGLTLADLSGGIFSAKRGPKTGGTVAAKYRDDAGNSWSGRGLQPKWLKAAIASGKSLADFAV
jgi:DNA-binding protein H-NS